MNTNIDEWISEFPHMREVIICRHFNYLFAKTQPVKGKRIGDQEWEQMTKQIGPLNIDAE